MASFHDNGNLDRREKSRQSYSGPIFYEYKNRLYKAEFKNRSVFGIFIKADDFFLVGETINVAIPLTEYRNHKYKGKIIWCDEEGCGVELLQRL
jgi:Tfp pilus assembly protein PilZ